MSGNPEPWDFTQAQEQLRRASVIERAGEQAYRGAQDDLAKKEMTYKIELAKEMVRLRGEGVAQTVAGDLARGDERIAQLRYERDLARGTLAAAHNGMFRRGRMYDGTREFVVWSRQVAPDGNRWPSHTGFQDVSAPRAA